MQLLLQNDDYKIYEVFDNDGNRSLLCIPNNNLLEYKICCSLNEDNLSFGDMLLKTSSIYSNILDRNKSFIYIHLLVEPGEIKEAAQDNDNPLYKALLKKMSATIDNTYQVLVKDRIAGFNNDIEIISFNEDDAKFIDWIEMNNALPINRMKLGNIVNRALDDLDISSEDTHNNEIIDYDYDLDKSLVNTKKKLAPNYGFGNIVSVIIILSVILTISIGAAYILIKQ